MKKIIFLGSSSCGKTSIIERLIYNTYNPNNDPTIGSGFYILPFKNNTSIGCWDTAGQDRFNSLVPMFFRDSMLAVLVCDITTRFSLDNIKRWIKYLNDNHSDIPYLIIGSKYDKNNNRTVFNEDLEKLILNTESQNKIVEVSAKSNYNIDKLRDLLQDKVLQYQDIATPPSSPVIKITSTKPSLKNKYCCTM
tara:strand:- start:103 stop:681 length:579 start_codon:yes stop_codon:yes gene_type:complete